MKIPMKQWRWFGHAGHLIVASSCRHHLHTRVGDYRISTIGDYYPRHNDEKPTTVGCDRLFETYVFRIVGECTECTDGDCGQGQVDWSEIDSLGANDWREAERNHMALCRKYADV